MTFENPFKKGVRVEFASSSEVRALQKNMDRLLSIIAVFHVGADGDIEEWKRYVFVSDQSSLGDFIMDEKEVGAISNELGFEICRSDYMVEIAARMSPPN